MSRKKNRRHGRPVAEQAALPIGNGADAVESGSDAVQADAVPGNTDAAGDEPDAVSRVGNAAPADDVAVETIEAAAPSPASRMESRLETGASPGVGARLRAAREAKGWSIAELSRATRLPANVLTDIEADRHARLGATIYVRGYLRTYAKAVGVPDVVVHHAVDQLAAETPPVLVVSHQTPRSTYLARRYGNALNYVVLTAVIVVPLLWLARQNAVTSYTLPRFEALDAPSAELVQPAAPVAVPPADAAQAPSTEAVSAGPPEPQAGTEPAPPLAVEEQAPLQPVMASMAPRAEPAVEQAPQRIVLRLAKASWVEFTGTDGNRIEYALLPAGTVREYQIVGTADLRIGNTRGARLEVDGQPVDLVPHTRANVARISVGRPVDGG